MSAEETGLARVVVDRTLCSGHGVCAHTLLRRVDLDEWGYPIVRDDVVDVEDGTLAVKLCPARALSLRPA